MKRAIDCKIVYLHAPGEDAWIVSIPTETAPDAVILLTAMLQGRLPQVKFSDQENNALICGASAGYTLAIADAQIAVAEVWLEAVLGMLLDVCLEGWTNTAHLDQDFGNICVSVAVLPPENGRL